MVTLMTDLDFARSPVSSEPDDQLTTESSPPPPPEPRSTLHSILDPIDSARNTPLASKRSNGNLSDDDGVKTPANATSGAAASGAPSTKGKKAAAEKASTVSSGYGSGNNKIRHLKKEDGDPLWRADIQHDFLKFIFEDKRKVFTNSYVPHGPKQTFAEVYIDAMARSSKTSKILRDKLWTDHEQAKNMAMVCLLVNIGRMNTTLNFFPEMRAQLRTYHAIPSLQAHQDRDSYKQLQDAPRLKSILKGASEDRKEPTTLEKIKSASIPRTNPVNLIFILTWSASKVTELHFPRPREFSDLIMRTSLSSESRALAFLWLMWFYLEGDFTEEGASENPFGPGVDYGQGLSNQGVPQLTEMSEAQEKLENVDASEELEYGRTKMAERKRIIEADQAALQSEYGSKRGGKPRLTLGPSDESPLPAARMRPPKHESDIDSTRSTPPRALGSKLRGQGTGKSRSLKHQIDNSSPAPPGFSHIIMQNDSNRRPRPMTAHQLAVEQNRNQRVNYILGRGMRKKYHQSRKIRRHEGAVVRAMNRVKELTDPFEDSESEDSFMKPADRFFERGFGGLVQCLREDDEFGEEFASYAATFRRISRRLERWDGPASLGFELSTAPAAADPAGGPLGGAADEETEDELALPQARPPRRVAKRRKSKKIVTPAVLDEDLDDIDKEILGLASEHDDDEDLDDVDKALLGMRGDETEDATEDDPMELD